MRGTTPSGNGVMSPFWRTTRDMWQTGHLPGHSETTPGHIGHQYSVSGDTPAASPPGDVSLSQ